MPRPSQRRKPKNPGNKPHLDSTYRAKKVPIRVAHHKHTGKRLPFYCTSYAVLFFLLIFTTTLILIISGSVRADQQSGIVQLSGQVKGKPPKVAAKITYPSGNARFTNSQIEVRGTCLEDTYVEIYRKKSFAGMTICSSAGTFSITITLAPGQNNLKARIRDNLGQYGPDSAIVTVYLDPKPSTKTQTSQVSKEDQKAFISPMLIYTDPVQRGISVGQTLSLDYEVDGNEAPYTIAIDWGDDSPTSLFKHDKEGDNGASHKYTTAGQRTIHISGIGAKGGKAVIQTIVVVHPTNAPITSTSKCGDNHIGSSFAEYCLPDNELIKIADLLWPTSIVAILMTGSFWVGEKITLRHFRPKH